MPAPEILVESALQLPNDVVQVVGYVNGKRVVASGWQSAITSFFDAASYDAAGNIKAGSVARAMTPAEKKAYAKKLLLDAAAVQLADAAPAPVPIGSLAVDSIPQAYIDAAKGGAP